MHRLQHFLFISLLFIGFSYGQEEKPIDQETDSLQQNLKDEGIVISDSIVVKKKPINPLAPSKAAFYSAVFPGLGQIYNKRYWKVPLVYGAIGGGVYMYTWNNDWYNRFRTAFKRRLAGFTDDEFYDRDNNNAIGADPDFSDEVLENQQERFQNDRDLWLVATIALYALNIVDANVDAHLKQFNVDEDLSMDFEPFMEIDPVTLNPNYGMALIIKF
ncbi:DUF5683 domain-containing protein [Aurantibacter sp.]|uniref:DUF5683 domain-containing protein n=1 Tax=Aurantibacter sp. TaxID=2807103 RepID=UPI003264DA5A